MNKANSQWAQEQTVFKEKSVGCVADFRKVLKRHHITHVLQLQEVGDFGDENCLHPQNLIRSKMFI